MSEEFGEAHKALLQELFGDRMPLGAVAAVDMNFAQPIAVLRPKLEAFIIEDYKRILALLPKDED